MVYRMLMPYEHIFRLTLLGPFDLLKFVLVRVGSSCPAMFEHLIPTRDLRLER